MPHTTTQYFWIAALFLVLNPSQLQAQSTPDTTHYSILSSGNPSGVSYFWSPAENEQRFFIEFNDRGRGPKLESRVVLNEREIPVLMEVTGHDYLKKPVVEHFELNGRTATWESEVEQQQKMIEEPAFYLSFSFENTISLIQALLASPDHTLPLLPDGKARIERVRAVEIEADRQKKEVSLYTILDMDTTPRYIWLDEDQNYFASTIGWFVEIRAGWESAYKVLSDVVEEEEDRRLEAWAAKYPRKPEASLVFQHVTLFDSENAIARPGMTVIVSGNRIETVEEDGKTAIPEGAEVIDGAGKMLMPGLWDMHGHMDAETGLWQLAGGVTTVRDLGSDPEKLPQIREDFASGRLIGPRLIMAIFIDKDGPFVGPTGVRVKNLDEALDAVARFADQGYEQVKLYSSIEPEWVAPIADAAHERGLRLSGHIPAHMLAEDAVLAGYDEIQHVNFLFLNFLSDTLDTRTPIRFTEPAEQAALLDLESAEVQHFVEVLEEHKTVLDPTVGVFESMLTARSGELSPAWASVHERLPVLWQRFLKAGGLPIPEGMDQRYRDSFAAFLHMIKKMYDAGIPIVAGTDGSPGFALHREMELYEEAGIPAPEVLQIATWKAAQVMGYEEELGSIAPGKFADVILVDGDPTTNISDIRRIELVVKDGVVYDPAELYSAIGIKPFQ